MQCAFFSCPVHFSVLTIVPSAYPKKMFCFWNNTHQIKLSSSTTPKTHLQTTNTQKQKNFYTTSMYRLVHCQPSDTSSKKQPTPPLRLPCSIRTIVLPWSKPASNTVLVHWSSMSSSVLKRRVYSTMPLLQGSSKLTSNPGPKALVHYKIIM